MKKSPEFEVSSGNVFADLGLPHPAELQAKADLMFEISRTIEERGLTQAEAAEILGVGIVTRTRPPHGFLDGAPVPIPERPGQGC